MATTMCPLVPCWAAPAADGECMATECMTTDARDAIMLDAAVTPATMMSVTIATPVPAPMPATVGSLPVAVLTAMKFMTPAPPMAMKHVTPAPVLLVPAEEAAAAAITAAATAATAAASSSAEQEAIPGEPLDHETTRKMIAALSPLPPVFRDKSALFAPKDRALSFATQLLAKINFETLCSVEQPVEDYQHYWGSGVKVTQKATIVALRWPGARSSVGSYHRAFAVFTEKSGKQVSHPYPHDFTLPHLYPHDFTETADHLYVINDKQKPQSVVMVKRSRNEYTDFSEQTKSGIKSLRNLLRGGFGHSYGIDSNVITTMLIGGAKAAAGLLPLDDARHKLLSLSTILKNAPAGSFGGEGQSNPSVSIGSGVSLLLWTPLVQPSADAGPAAGSSAAASGGAADDDDTATAPAAGGKAAGKKKAKPAKPAKPTKPTTGAATRQLLQAIADLAPPTEAAPRKPTFKMAKLADPESSSLDRAAGWGGDCGRFNDFGMELFLQMLEACTLHSRLVLTELTCKSFRMLRLEPELFARMSLAHTESLKMAEQLQRSTYKSGICCPASHFVNLLQAKKSVVKRVDFVGGSTPLTAIKASLKLIGSQLTALSLRGETNINSLTIKEVGKCPNLTYLDLNCSRNLEGVRDEEVIIEAVRGMKQLKTLRLAPFGPFNRFIGDWRFVKRCLNYRNPGVEQYNLEEEVEVDDHDFCEGTEGDVEMCYYKLRELQLVLPRGCKLTNNGKWAGASFLTDSWGTAFDEDAAEWSVFGARSYQQMGTLHYKPTLTANGSDGSVIHKGLVKTVWLQCGDPEELAADGATAKRFYTSADEWHAANPVVQEEKPIGPVIET